MQPIITGAKRCKMAPENVQPVKGAKEHASRAKHGADTNPWVLVVVVNYRFFSLRTLYCFRKHRPENVQIQLYFLPSRFLGEKRNTFCSSLKTQFSFKKPFAVVYMPAFLA